MNVKLPKLLLNGRASIRMISDIMRPREANFEHLFEGAGLEQLGHYYVAPFQRPAVWTLEQQQRLIESLWLGIPIGGIVVTREGEMDPKTNKFPISADLVIDGQQRMRAIDAYMEHDLEVFVGTEYAHRYNDLDRPQQRKFESKTINYTELDEFDMDALRELYNRLNFSGTAHSEDQRA